MAGSILVTGGAGFIGSHLTEQLLVDGWRVTVVDDFDPFYDPSVKRHNVAVHARHGNYALVETDIRDIERLRTELTGDFNAIVHLAAKAGVRPSIQDPLEYQDVNVRGTHNLLEFAREREISQFVFASSSSVYGISPSVPWREDDPVLMPISPYAATKVSGELLGKVYSHLFGIRFVALRFFTVYGPRQRPDLAIHKFARLMLDGKPIPVFGDGTTRRDYTYIDDIVAGVQSAINYRESACEVINLGNNNTVSLMEMIETLADVLDVDPRLQFMDEQPGDVPQTWADLGKATQLLGYRPATEFRDGLAQFANWLKLSRSGVHAVTEIPHALRMPAPVALTTDESVASQG
ncbi:MAG: GDP-mannose 4,6-dehydratase [Nitrolancea sp.]